MRRAVVIEQVVLKVTTAIVYPILTRTNYSEWDLIMCVNLHIAGMWEVINKGTDDYCDDRNALAALLQAVPQEMQAGIMVKESVKQALDAICSIRVNVNKVKEANTQKLHREFDKFDDISFKSGECVEELAMHISVSDESTQVP
jgi:hypothetical protein